MDRNDIKGMSLIWESMTNKGEPTGEPRRKIPKPLDDVDVGDDVETMPSRIKNMDGGKKLRDRSAKNGAKKYVGPKMRSKYVNGRKVLVRNDEAVEGEEFLPPRRRIPSTIDDINEVPGADEFTHTPHISKKAGVSDKYASRKPYRDEIDPTLSGKPVSPFGKASLPSPEAPEDEPQFSLDADVTPSDGVGADSAGHAPMGDPLRKREGGVSRRMGDGKGEWNV